jgi:hypothetical protein
MAKRPGGEQPCRGYLPPRHDPSVAPMDRGNLPQQVSSLDWGVILAHAVAARDQNSFFAEAALPHDAMNEQTSATSVKHHIARLGLIKIVRLNGNAITRPQSR